MTGGSLPRQRLLGSIILLLVLSWTGWAWAQCDTDTNLTLIYNPIRWWDKEEDWPDELDDIIQSALNHFDIEGALLTWRAEGTLSDDPLLTITSLEQDLPGKRIVLFHTHGDTAHWPAHASMAAEWYETRTNMVAAYEEYVGAGYAHDVEIRGGIWEVGQDTLGFCISLTNIGIERRLKGGLAEDVNRPGIAGDSIL